MLTGRGRWVLLTGGLTYVIAWAFGTVSLYPVSVGLVLAAAAAVAWVRLVGRPGRLRRALPGGRHLDGDDVPVELELTGSVYLPASSLVVSERITRLGDQETALRRYGGGLRGSYVLRGVPRGRYAIESARVIVEDPFGLARRELALPQGGSVLVYPRLTDLDHLFSERGNRLSEGRRLLLRRMTGFDFHSVREHEQGESLRRVHWPSTARRGQLMVKELEDSPRDEAVVLLDAEASVVVGEPPASTFEVQVRAAGSVLRAQAGRGRRTALIVNSARSDYQPVQSADGDWKRAFELLAAVEPDGETPAASFLSDEFGPAARALELTVVTSNVSARLVERLVQRVFSRHPASLVFVDPNSFLERPRPTNGEVAGRLLRLQKTGVPVAVLRRGDDLAAKLSPGAMGVQVG